MKKFILTAIAFLCFAFLLGFVRSIFIYGLDEDDYDDDMMFDSGM